MIYLELFLTFFCIGLFTFGGGYAMLPLIQQEVARQGWLTDAQLVDFVAVSESTPGPFAVNIATYVGMQTGGGTENILGGFLGAICATLGVVLPSFIIILIVAKIYDAFKENKIVKGCMTGLKPAVIGLIASAIVSMGNTVLFAGNFNLNVFSELQFYISILIFAVMTLLSFKKVHPILIVCLSAIAGIGVGYALDLKI